MRLHSSALCTSMQDTMSLQPCSPPLLLCLASIERIGGDSAQGAPSYPGYLVTW